ncbi:TetR/AcrR family transcriptional regulator [Nocardioides sp. NPDC051685]|uniref:TetR/AcrR family transcriptional regulator n=1 Tax=Nocardioides sp. NPDC051685 TaxID=3364334 RepID=UPI0037B0F559
MSSAVRTRRSRPGRPRHVPAVDDTLSPRDQILDASARLFVGRGFANTSTREIADAVGIRQASLYYHYAGKEEILGELLSRTVRPTLDQIEKIEDIAAESGWAAALYALVMIDSKTLVDAPHNSGLLAICPDVTSLEMFKPYRSTLRDLCAAYERFGRAVASVPYVSGVRLEHEVSIVVRYRAEGDVVSVRDRHVIAAGVLRACGATREEIEIAAAVSWAELLEDE